MHNGRGYSWRNLEPRTLIKEVSRVLLCCPDWELTFLLKKNKLSGKRMPDNWMLTRRDKASDGTGTENVAQLPRAPLVGCNDDAVLLRTVSAEQEMELKILS